MQNVKRLHRPAARSLKKKIAMLERENLELEKSCIEKDVQLSEA